LKGLQVSLEVLKGMNDGSEPALPTKFPSQINLLERLTLGNENKALYMDREIYIEEEEKITSWKKRINDQDNNLRDIVKDIKVLGKEAKNIGDNQREIGLKIGVTNKMASKTDLKIKGTSQKLRGLVEKFKAPDRFCIDILLCCICLGLIAILYYLIKSKFFTTKTTKTSTSESYSISLDFFIMGLIIILYI
jgi:hypothetical protein